VHHKSHDAIAVFEANNVINNLSRRACCPSLLPSRATTGLTKWTLEVSRIERVIEAPVMGNCGQQEERYHCSQAEQSRPKQKLKQFDVSLHFPL
jgi:hypothetical protein